MFILHDLPAFLIPIFGDSLTPGFGDSRFWGAPDPRFWGCLGLSRLWIIKKSLTMGRRSLRCLFCMTSCFCSPNPNLKVRLDQSFGRFHRSSSKDKGWYRPVFIGALALACAGALFFGHISNFWTLLLISSVLAVMLFAILDAKRALRRALGDIHRLRKATVKAMTLVAIAHDDETGAHLQRCSLYANVLGRQLQLDGVPIDNAYVDALAIAVPLHDIGKVGIPESVLKKPGKHTPEEQATMRLHPEIGRKIVTMLSEEADVREKLVFEIAQDVTIAHHENWDGSGYPSGQIGEAIPFAARIMAIIDVYDAVSSRRCYKEPCSHDEVVRIIKGLSGTKFDPALVASFLSVSHQFRRIFVENPDYMVINQSP